LFVILYRKNKNNRDISVFSWDNFKVNFYTCKRRGIKKICNIIFIFVFFCLETIIKNYVKIQKFTLKIDLFNIFSLVFIYLSSYWFKKLSMTTYIGLVNILIF
jgi:hypothetical protein